MKILQILAFFCAVTLAGAPAWAYQEVLGGDLQTLNDKIAQDNKTLADDQAALTVLMAKDHFTYANQIRGMQMKVHNDQVNIDKDQATLDALQATFNNEKAAFSKTIGQTPSR